VSVVVVNEPEPILVAMAVGVEPVILKMTTVGELPEPPELLVMEEPPQPTTRARAPQRAGKRKVAKGMKIPRSTWGAAYLRTPRR
jgi:hypothetical protein